MVNAQKPMLMIVDDHPIPDVRMVKGWVEGLNDKHKMLYVPPYSPHLNPDKGVSLGECETEGLTKLIKGAEDMKPLALGVLRSIQKPLNS